MEAESSAPALPKCPNGPVRTETGPDTVTEIRATLPECASDLASINQEFLTKPYLFGKLLTNTNALEVSK